MKNKTQSLSEQHQRRGDLILLIVGIVLLGLLFMTMCSMSKEQKQPEPPRPTGGGDTEIYIPGIGEPQKPDVPDWEPGTGELSVAPDSVTINSNMSITNSIILFSFYYKQCLQLQFHQ